MGFDSPGLPLSPEWKQAIYSLGALVNLMSLGMVTAYSGTLLPSLKDPSSQIKIDVKTASWIAAIPGVSGVIPILLLGPLMHYGGRKPANFFLLVPVLFGWVLTYFAGQYNSISMLLTGRFFQGICTASVYFISVCLGEFSSPKMRSTFLCLKPVFVVTGVLVMHSMAYFLDWKHLALVGTVPPSLGILVTIFWPETPDWLVSRGRYEEAKVVFYSIRGYSDMGVKEMSQMIECDRKRRRFDEDNSQKFDVWKKVKSPVLWRPVWILFFAVLVPTVGGRQFVPAYSVELCSQLSGDKTKGYFYTVVVDVVALIAVFSSLYLVRKFRRRQLLFVSGSVGIILLGLSSFLMYIRTLYPSKTLAWLNLSAFGAYYFIGNACFMPVSYILMGEIIPLEYRAIGSVIDGVLGIVEMAIVLGVTPFIERSIGFQGLLLIFGCLMLVSLVYLYFELPETKDRTLHDIGDYFRGISPKFRHGNDFAVNIEENKLILEKQKY